VLRRALPPDLFEPCRPHLVAALTRVAPLDGDQTTGGSDGLSQRARRE
jgi:hypothetical protein